MRYAMMCCATRIGLSYEAEAQDLTSDELIKEILNRVEVP